MSQVRRTTGPSYVGGAVGSLGRWQGVAVAALALALGSGCATYDGTLGSVMTFSPGGTYVVKTIEGNPLPYNIQTKWAEPAEPCLGETTGAAVTEALFELQDGGTVSWQEILRIQCSSNGETITYETGGRRYTGTVDGDMSRIDTRVGLSYNNVGYIEPAIPNRFTWNRIEGVRLIRDVYGEEHMTTVRIPMTALDSVRAHFAAAQVPQGRFEPAGVYQLVSYAGEALPAARDLNNNRIDDSACSGEVTGAQLISAQVELQPNGQARYSETSRLQCVRGSTVDYLESSQEFVGSWAVQGTTSDLSLRWAGDLPRKQADGKLAFNGMTVSWNPVGSRASTMQFRREAAASPAAP